MTSATSRLSGLGLRPALARGLNRFPVPAAFAALATIVVLSLSTPAVMSDNALSFALVLLATASVAGFVAALAAALVTEREGWTGGRRQLASALAGAAAFLPAWLLQERLDLLPWLYVPALIVLLTLAGTGFRRLGDEAFWLFNHDLWVGAAIALVAVVLLAGGLSAIIATSGYLLGTPWSGEMVMRLWTLALGFIGPIIWLTQVPTAGQPVEGEGYAAGLLSNAIAAIVIYVMVPLQLIYAVVLHLYAGKIALAWALPDGELGWMVLLYGAAVVGTALLGFPARMSGRSWMRLYWRIWPWILAVPAILLQFAIFERIGVYGWTEQRYLIVLFGIWLGLVILTQGLPTPLRSIRMIPALAGGLALIASFGPWGVTGFPDRMQVGSVVAALGEAGALGADGRVTAWPDLSKLPIETQRRASAGLDHLARRERLDQLAPLFGGMQDSPFTDASLDTFVQGERLRQKLTLNPPMAGAAAQGLGFYVQAPVVVDRPGATRFIGPYSLDEGSSERRVNGPDGEIVASLKGGVVAVIEQRSGARAEFALGAMPELQAAMENQARSGADISAMAPLVLKRSSGTLDAELVLVQAWGVKDLSGKTAVNQAGFWVLIGKAAVP